MSQQLAQFSKTNAKEVEQEIEQLTLSVSNVQALRDQHTPGGALSFNALTNDDLYYPASDEERSGGECGSALSFENACDEDYYYLETGNPLHVQPGQRQRQQNSAFPRYSPRLSGYRSTQQNGRPRNDSIITNASGGGGGGSGGGGCDGEVFTRSSANSPVQLQVHTVRENEGNNLLPMMASHRAPAMLIKTPQEKSSLSMPTGTGVGECAVQKTTDSRVLAVKFAPATTRPATDPPSEASKAQALRFRPPAAASGAIFHRRTADINHLPSPVDSRAGSLVSLSTLSEAPDAQNSYVGGGSVDTGYSTYSDDSDGYF